MPAKKSIKRYEIEMGEAITGISHEIFDSAPSNAILNVKCKCGNIFATKRTNLVDRFNRKNNIACVNCVNKENIKKRYEKEQPESD